MKLKINIICSIFGILMSNLIYAQETPPLLNKKKELIEKTEGNSVIIKSLYKEPLSIHNKNTVILKGVDEGEFVEILIQGSIKDFEHVKLEMKNSGDLYETEVLHKYDQLSNQTLIIKTIIPEGIPMEMIKWKSQSGKEYEFIIAENGKDGSPEEFNLN